MTAPAVATAPWYDSSAKEAARHYCTLFPDARIDSIFPQQGDPRSRAFIVGFTLQGQRFQAMNGGPHYRLTPAASISVLIDTQDEIDRLWAALLAGGGEASRCGWLTDRWGLSWQIVPRALLRLLRGPKADAVAQAMAGMVKLDIAAPEAAAKG